MNIGTVFGGPIIVMKKKRKNTLKKWAGRLHLWLGLITGIIVFIVAVTGCIYVFHDEIKDMVYDWRTVEVQDKAYMAPSQIRKNVSDRFPGATNDFLIYAGKDRPVAVYGTYEKDPYYFYYDPYSGKFLYAQNFREDFFEIIKAIHMYLLLPTAIGKQVVGISTLIFILMMVTGIILWWPKKLKNFRKNLKIKWKARWRRVNYDLHGISGFYIHILAIIIAITGLNFSYEWVSDGIKFAGNLGHEYDSDEVMEHVEPEEETVKNAVDIAFFRTMELKPGEDMYFVWDLGEGHSIATGTYPNSLNYDHQSNFYFHPDTAELLQTHYYDEKSNGMKLQEMSYGIHTGQYFGMAGKIIAFIASLFVAALPVTGFIVWYGRKNRKKHLFKV